MTDKPRVPLPAEAAVAGLAREIQVNHCRQPSCANFGVPARTKQGKTGPSADRDLNYKVHSTNKGQTPSIKCKGCGDNPPMKSNASIAAEVRRLVRAGGILRTEEMIGCRNPGCQNHGLPIALHPKQYRKCGLAGGAQNHQCKSCGRKMLASKPVRLHDAARRQAVDVFSRIANKSPVRRAVNGARLPSARGYYSLLDFIHARCREHSGRFDRACMDGRARLPADMNLETDMQEYTLNWVSRLDRRNVVLSAHCTVDVDTRFILGLHANFDDGADPFATNAEAAKAGELDGPEAFRKHAHYWLAGDELRSGRAMSRSVIDRRTLARQVEALYANAESREDVENIKLQHHNESYRTPFMTNGLQAHMPYTAYAHWQLLHRIFTGGGAVRVQAIMNMKPMNRAAFLCAFKDEVKRGDAHAFYVRYDKFKTVDEREAILAESRRKRQAFARTLPPDIRRDRGGRPPES